LWLFSPHPDHFRIGRKTRDIAFWLFMLLKPVKEGYLPPQRRR